MESHVHQAVINYLKLQYPKVLFRSDSGAGMKLSIGQAKRQKAIQNGMKWPDLFIAEGRRGCKGMFIELKDEGYKTYKKDGVTAVNEHIEGQRQCLKALCERGYYADFACGFEEAKQKIDWYLN